MLKNNIFSPKTALCVKINGESNVSFNNYSKLQKATFLAETYLDERILLFDGNKNYSKVMAAGNYTYNFTFDLRDNLPQSEAVGTIFENVAYDCRAVLDIFGGSKKTSKDVKFALKSRTDLNWFPLARFPIVKRTEKSFYCFFSVNRNSTSDLSMEVSLPYAGFTAGEDISINVKYINRGKVKVIKTRIELKKYTSKEFPAKHLSETDSIKTLLTTYAPGVNSYDSVEFIATLTIPVDASPSELFHSELIKVENFITVIGEVNGFNFNPTVDIPIVIGTIPFK